MREAAFAVTCVALLSGCDASFIFGDCGVEPVSSVLSPDRRSRAVIFVKNCGATTPYTTQVVLLEPTRTFDSSTQGFFVAPDRLALQVSWFSPHELQVTDPAGSDVSSRALDSGGVHITYDTR